jgi:hypothetical protein
MAENPENNPLLNQLQAEINTVLEQTARLIKAASKDSKEIPLPQLLKLKQVVPAAQDRFHNALDQLEDELVIYITSAARDLH